MRIGIALELHGTGSGERPVAADWGTVRDSAVAAEEAGFDRVVVEDVFLGENSERPSGAWESVATLGGLAAATTTIGIGHSMVNAPYRTPSMIASMANTLDEMSGGRYVLGLGAGNTSDEDYAAAGVASDLRYSRFAECVEVVDLLLKRGGGDFAGSYASVSGARLLVRPAGDRRPPIVIAARGPKMMRLAARYADEWNANAYVPQTVDAFRPMVAELDVALEEVGRDPATLGRSIDLVVHAPDVVSGAESSELGKYLVNGSRGEIAERIREFGELGISEARCYLSPPLPPDQRVDAIRSMQDIVELVHAD